MIDWRSEVMNLCECELLSWETVARECLQEMSQDHVHEICTALGIDEDIECPYDDGVE